jgi:MoaA/NifB/PqqE/SkfB family radical SAM enzyme
MFSVNLNVNGVEEIFEGETLEAAKAKQHARINQLQAEFREKHKNDIERPAENVRGFLLYSPLSKKHFFRIYGPVDPETGRKTFTDYRLNAEDIEVTIHAGGLSLYENPDGEHRLDWSSQVLGRKKKE